MASSSNSSSGRKRSASSDELSTQRILRIRLQRYQESDLIALPLRLDFEPPAAENSDLLHHSQPPGAAKPRPGDRQRPGVYLLGVAARKGPPAVLERHARLAI